MSSVSNYNEAWVLGSLVILGERVCETKTLGFH